MPRKTKPKIVIEKVKPYHLASHIDLAEKFNELIDAVNALAAGKLPANLEPSPVMSDQTKEALDEISATLEVLQGAVEDLARTQEPADEEIPEDEKSEGQTETTPAD